MGDWTWRSEIGDGRIFRSPSFKGEKWRYCTIAAVNGKPAPGAKEVMHTIEISDVKPRPPGTISKRTASPTEARLAVRELAEKERRDAEAAKVDPAKVPATEITVKAGFEEWLSKCYPRDADGVLKNRKESTVKESQLTAGMLGRLLGPETPVSSLSYRVIEDLFTVWLPARKIGAKRTLRDKTLGGHLRFVKRFLAWCLARNYLKGQNPAAQFEEQSSVARDWKEAMSTKPQVGQALTHEECVKLLRAARDPFKILFTRKGYKPFKKPVDLTPPPYLYPSILLMLKAGLRRGNVFGENAVRWGDFLGSLDTPGKELLHLPAARLKNGRRLGDLHVPIHLEAAQALRELRASLKRVPRDDETIFSVKNTTTGKRTAKISITRAFTSAVKRAGLNEGRARKLRVHDLRHTAISSWAATMPFSVKEKLAGHVPASQNEEYVHLDVETLRKHLKKVPWFFPVPKPAKARPRLVKGSAPTATEIA